jgi:tetratricopeptide (TPR) repeat protein
MKNCNATILIPFLLAAVLLAGSCAQQPAGKVYIKDGKEYGKTSGYIFRHTWWNYYERGLSFADGEFYQEAIADFTQAIDQRHQDQRLARTYGMHFIDYFPHREIGIVFFQTGDLEKAKVELELSLEQFPSAKAYFYLDQVRKAMIKKEAREIKPPRITLNFQSAEIWTREDPVVVSGVVEDNYYVSGLWIDGLAVFLESSQKRLPFAKNLALSQGRHAIQVTAENLAGKRSASQVIIHVDRIGPMIVLDELRLEPKGQQQEATLIGSIYDETGIDAVSINDQPVAIEKSTEVRIATRIIISDGQLKLAAQDRLGNATSALIPLTIASVRQISRLLAQTGSDRNHFLIAGLFGPKDNQPPSIQLKDWTDAQTVFMKKIYIEGLVSDEGKIKSLTINQMPLLPRMAHIFFFNHIIELKEGENSVSIEAVDDSGNKAYLELNVVRKIPKALQLAQRMSLTVFPFEQLGKVSSGGLVFQDNLIDALVNQQRFRVLERDKLDVILEEQKLSRTQLVDRNTALKVGRLAAAESLITGTIVESRQGIEVVGRLIDTETSEILDTEDVYNEVKDIAGIKLLAEGMAIKFHIEFPLVDGMVIERKKDNIFTDLGNETVKIGRRLIVYREEPLKHPLTGKVIGTDNIIMGRARVLQVMPEMSKAELLDGKDETITPMDRVITE